MRHRMIKAGIAVLAVVALAGCSSGSGPVAPLATTPAVLTAPDPGKTPLDPAKAATLQAVLTKVVSQYAATPDSESAARGITAALVTDQWTWSGAAARTRV
jgi:D-alanyl-D-alanine carboxypeptidase